MNIAIVLFIVTVLYKNTLQYNQILFSIWNEEPKLKDYKLQFPKRHDNNYKNDCAFTGLICENCTSIAHCTERNGLYHKEIVGKCKRNRYCFDGICTKSQVPACDESYKIPFPCSSMGLYPDPFHCDKFQFCIPEATTGLQAKCEPGYAYNPNTTFCDIPIRKAEHCYEKGNYPVPLCLTEGQSGALGNPTLYYICISFRNVLYPLLNKCPHGLKYNTYNFTCS